MTFLGLTALCMNDIVFYMSLNSCPTPHDSLVENYSSPIHPLFIQLREIFWCILNFKMFLLPVVRRAIFNGLHSRGPRPIVQDLPPRSSSRWSPPVSRPNSKQASFLASEPMLLGSCPSRTSLDHRQWSPRAIGSRPALISTCAERKSRIISARH